MCNRSIGLFGFALITAVSVELNSPLADDRFNSVRSSLRLTMTSTVSYCRESAVYRLEEEGEDRGSRRARPFFHLSFLKRNPRIIGGSAIRSRPRLSRISTAPRCRQYSFGQEFVMYTVHLMSTTTNHQQWLKSKINQINDNDRSNNQVVGYSSVSRTHEPTRVLIMHIANCTQFSVINQFIWTASVCVLPYITCALY